jgi:hypothetical protein
VGRVNERASIRGREDIQPESSVKNSSAVWIPAADGKCARLCWTDASVYRELLPVLAIEG